MNIKSKKKTFSGAHSNRRTNQIKTIGKIKEFYVFNLLSNTIQIYKHQIIILSVL